MGTKKNLKEAFNWYRRSGEQGDPAGQLELGLCYQHGCGVGNDLVKAKFWIKKAALNGNDEARKILASEFGRKGKSGYL